MDADQQVVLKDLAGGQIAGYAKSSLQEIGQVDADQRIGLKDLKQVGLDVFADGLALMRNSLGGLAAWPNWKNRSLDPIPGIGGDDADSLTSDTCSSSDAETPELTQPSEPEGVQPKRALRRWRLRCALRRRMAKPPRQVPDSWQLHEGLRDRRSFFVAPGLLDEADQALVHSLAQHPSVRSRKLAARDDELVYRHDAYRIELPLRAHGRELYERLLDRMLLADACLWAQLKPKRSVYPEIEYLVYDASDGKSAGIEPHVDSESVVTCVVLLSMPEDYEGGCICFDPSGHSGSLPRKLRPNKGDAVIFRGEKLQHWVESVTSGQRLVLQIELSRI